MPSFDELVRKELRATADEQSKTTNKAGEQIVDLEPLARKVTESEEAGVAGVTWRWAEGGPLVLLQNPASHGDSNEPIELGWWLANQGRYTFLGIDPDVPHCASTDFTGALTHTARVVAHAMETRRKALEEKYGLVEHQRLSA